MVRYCIAKLKNIQLMAAMGSVETKLLILLIRFDHL